MILTVKIIGCQQDDLLAEKCQGYEIGNCHEAVDGFGQVPQKGRSSQRAQYGGQGMQGRKNVPSPVSKQKLRAAHAVESPAKNGGEGEEDHGQCQKDGDPLTVDRGKR